MNKTERECWEGIVEDIHTVEEKLSPYEEAICAADVYIRKLERELQALKHKKAVAAILQKRTST